MGTPAIDHRTLPYRIAVLCYVYDGDGHLLLLHRLKKPNRDLYSPIGGKLDVQTGEGPHACALREIGEETGLELRDDEIRLTGIVSETAYDGETHWLIFLFEVLRPIEHDEITAMEFDEGTLEWVAPDDVPGLDIPQTDRDIMWPLVREHHGGFFMVHIDCREEPMRWTVVESEKRDGDGAGAAEGNAPRGTAEGG